MQIFFKSQYRSTNGSRVVRVEARAEGAKEGAIHDVSIPAGTPVAEAYRLIAQQASLGVPENDEVREVIQSWIDSRKPWEVDPGAFLATAAAGTGDATGTDEANAPQA